MPLDGVLDMLGSIGALHSSIEHWAGCCAYHAGIGRLSPLERKVLVHLVLRHDRNGFASLCFDLKIREQHLMTYALRKLEQSSLVRRALGKKEVRYEPTESGKEMASAYCGLLTQSYDAVKVMSDSEIAHWQSLSGKLVRGIDGALMQVLDGDLVDAPEVRCPEREPGASQRG